MDVLPLSQLQFAVTTVYHFFFVPLTLGLALFVAIVQTQYVRTGDEKYKQLTKFWGKLLVINFAMGVVTGIVQEFQFGMNWAEYSRFVGDIFGAPLAIEALAAFFVESVFLGVWIFGWDRLGKKMHLAAIWLVALAAMLSAFWILVANSFMQNPVGYRIAASGRAEMTDFFALITNPNVLLQFPHVLLGGLTTAGFFVMGISAYHLLRGKHRNLAGFRTSFRWAAWLAAVSVLVTMGFGHAQGQQMANTQPMKLAAAEGLWETEDPAGLSLFQIGDENDRESLINIRVPSLLSFLTFNTVDGQVQGINDLQAAYTAQYGEGNYVPPFIWLTYWSFRAMVGAGVVMFVAGGRGPVPELQQPARTLAMVPAADDRGHLPALSGQYRGLAADRSRAATVDRAGPDDRRPRRVTRYRPRGRGDLADRLHADLRRIDDCRHLPAAEVRPRPGR